MRLCHCKKKSDKGNDWQHSSCWGWKIFTKCFGFAMHKPHPPLPPRFGGMTHFAGPPRTMSSKTTWCSAHGGPLEWAWQRRFSSRRWILNVSNLSSLVRQIWLSFYSRSKLRHHSISFFPIFQGSCLLACNSSFSAVGCCFSSVTSVSHSQWCCLFHSLLNDNFNLATQSLDSLRQAGRCLLYVIRGSCMDIYSASRPLRCNLLILHDNRASSFHTFKKLPGRPGWLKACLMKLKVLNTQVRLPRIWSSGQSSASQAWSTPVSGTRVDISRNVSIA